jgi:hypothetical protein
MPTHKVSATPSRYPALPAPLRGRPGDLRGFAPCMFHLSAMNHPSLPDLQNVNRFEFWEETACESEQLARDDVDLSGVPPSQNGQLGPFDDSIDAERFSVHCRLQADEKQPAVSNLPGRIISLAISGTGRVEIRMLRWRLPEQRFEREFQNPCTLPAVENLIQQLSCAASRPSGQYGHRGTSVQEKRCVSNALTDQRKNCLRQACFYRSAA